MAPRQRKKEPPDLIPSPLESPLPSISIVHLANSLLTSRFRLQFASFPCSNFVFSSSAVADSSQICCPSQLVAKVRRQIRWVRVHLPPSTFQEGGCAQQFRVCVGLPGHTRGSPSAVRMGSAIQFRGPRSANCRVSLSSLAKLFGKIASHCSLSLLQPQHDFWLHHVLEEGNSLYSALELLEGKLASWCCKFGCY
uniref:Uncharacterized protein n=1 Tax=Opuntia streptacantha TaxID=393608 RepID=A0A7C9EYU7_OPUST